MRRVRGGSACLAAGIVVALAGCAADVPTGPSATTTPTTAPAHSALKTIVAAGFRDVVQRLAQQMRVPGAVVVLRTPARGDFTAAVGTTELDIQVPPTAATHFRIASNKDDDRGADRAAGSARQTAVLRSGRRLCAKCAERQRHHHRRTSHHAQRTGQLHRRP